MEREKLEKLEDEKLIELYRNGSTKAVDILINRYKNFVRSRVRTNFFIGADREDLIQEGMIGLFKAINDYDEGRKASFKSFASICIKGQISTALTTATRQKHKPLNTSISLDKPIFRHDTSKVTLLDFIKVEPSEGPEELVLRQEKVMLMERELSKVLSKLESKVLRLYIEGRSYLEISRVLEKPTKSVDNALQRIKGKSEDIMLDKAKTI